MTITPIRWLAGASPGLTYATVGATATLFNSLANNSTVSSPQIDNTTNLDEWLQSSFEFKPNATTTIASSTVLLYLLPLNEDATTYGDNSIGTNTSAAVTPDVAYLVGQVKFGVAVTSSQVLHGTFQPIRMDPIKFILAIQNVTGAALNAAAAAAWQYKTWSEGVG